MVDGRKEEDRSGLCACKARQGGQLDHTSSHDSRQQQWKGQAGGNVRECVNGGQWLDYVGTTDSYGLLWSKT